MHPLARKNNRTSENGMKSGDRVRHSFGKVGTVDEFLADGDALVSWDDGTHATVKWSALSKFEIPVVSTEEFKKP